MKYLVALLAIGSFVFTSCEKEPEFVECVEICNNGNSNGHNNGNVQVCEGGDSISEINTVDTNFVECGNGLIVDTNAIIYCNGFICADSANWNYSSQSDEQVYCVNQQGTSQGASQGESYNGFLSIGCGLVYFNDPDGDLDVYEYQEDLFAKTITWTNVLEGGDPIVWRIIFDQPNKRVLETIILDDWDDYCKSENVITMTLSR